MSHALVLAGGGVTGIAWETGVLRGFAEQGHDLVHDVDLVVGTSAGSTVGAQILSGTSIEKLYELQLEEAHGEINPRIDLELMAVIFGELAAGGTSTNEQRQKIGELALRAETVDEATRRKVIETRLISHNWPTTPFVVTAINAHTGEFVTWTKDSNISIIDAVTSSCAVPGVWPCVTINGDMYYDGGLRNSANAFLADGYDTVTILAPLTAGMGPLVESEIQTLRDHGSDVRVITADAEAIEAMGPNSLDPRMRAIAAQHGLRQGRAFTL